MVKMKCNIHKWSFSEMTSNGDGKTSSSGTMGSLIIFIGCVTFLIGCIGRVVFDSNDIDVITQSIIFVGIGAGLLGYRKSKGTVVPLIDGKNDEAVPILVDPPNTIDPGTPVADPSMDLSSSTCPACGYSPCECMTINS